MCEVWRQAGSIYAIIMVEEWVAEEAGLGRAWQSGV